MKINHIPDHEVDEVIETFYAMLRHIETFGGGSTVLNLLFCNRAWDLLNRLDEESPDGSRASLFQGGGNLR